MASLYLESVSGGKQAELSGDVVAGRSEESDLVLTEGHPSRRHAQITVRDDGPWVEDLGSTNGTFVNGDRIDAPVRLAVGDRVRFDAEEFMVVDRSAPAAGAGAPDPNATVLRAPPPSLEPESGRRERAAADKAPAAAEKAPAAPEKAPAAPAAPAAAERAPAAAEKAPAAAEKAPAAAEKAPAAAEKAPAAAEKAPAAPNKKKETVEAAAAGGGRRPGAWADPNQVKEGGTVLFDDDQLQALLAEPQPSPLPLADADAPYLVVTAGAQAGTTVKLKAGQQTNVWDIGRDAGRDIVFDENGVSGFHAKIVNEGSRWKVIDQMSANGTLVNEKKGTISFLSPGDRIRFGPVECVFQLPSGATSTRAGGGRSGSRSMLVWAVVVAVLVAAAVAGYLLLLG